MYKKMCRILLFLFFLSFVVGCAGLRELKGSEKLEAKDWLHSGDLAYRIGDYDNAQYFYELVIRKYPDTYYAKKAKSGLNKVNLKRSMIGRAAEKAKEFVDPIL